MRSFDEIDKLVTNNIKLAYFLCFECARDLDQADALSVAMEGLMKAARTYEYVDKGLSFGTYASLHIKWKLKALRRFIYATKRGSDFQKISLNSHIKDGDDETLESIIADEKSSNASENVCELNEKEIITKYLNTLSNREKDILSFHFGLNGYKSLSLDEIAIKFKRSRQRMQIIEQRALKKMRQKLYAWKYNK